MNATALLSYFVFVSSAAVARLKQLLCFRKVGALLKPLCVSSEIVCV
jgi:hypothetical protein